MAVSTQPTAQLYDFFTVVRRKKWWLVFPPILGIIAASIALGLIPKQYEASTLIEIREVVLRADRSVANLREHPVIRNLPLLHEQIKDLQRLQRVIESELDWWEGWEQVRDDPADRRQYLEMLQDRVTVRVAFKQEQIGNDRVSISYIDSDPERARSFVEALSRTWRDEETEDYKFIIEQQHSRKKKNWDLLASDMVETRTAMTTIVRDNDLPSSAGEIGNRNQTFVDPKEELLEERRKELIRIEEEIRGLKPLLAAEQALRDELPPFRMNVINQETGGLPPELLKVVQDLEDRKRLLQAEQQRYTPLHFKHKLYKKDIEEIDAQLAQLQQDVEVNSEAQQEANPDWKAQFKKVQEMRQQQVSLESHREGLLEFIPKLEAEVVGRKDAYAQLDALEQSYIDKQGQLEKQRDETTVLVDVLRALESDAGNPFAVKLAPITPREPVYPNTTMILLIGLFAGLVFGAVMLLLTEYGRLSFRSSEDVSNYLNVPVLGAVNRMWTIHEVRRRRWTRTLTFSIVLLFIAGLAGFLYLYQNHPDRLPPVITRWIDSLRGEG